MLRFIAFRLLQLIPVAFAITLLTFFLLRLIPGDPAANALGMYITPERLAALRAKFGLDQPLIIQYLIFLGNIFRGDFGFSYFFKQPALDLVLERLGPEVFLLTYAVVLSLMIGIPLGILAGVRREGIADQFIRAIMVLGISLPAFWIGLVLLLILGIWVPIFPVGGFGEGWLGHLRSLFLPAMTISLSLVPLIIRALRASVIETLQQDHVDMARSKGLSRRRILSRHVLRPALIPTVTVLGVNLGFLVGGTVVIESVFGIPGVGQLMVSSVYARDYPTIQAVTLVFAALVVLVNLVTDVIVAVLDPRARAAMVD
jgi:peptide/nickel transport system permease protein